MQITVMGTGYAGLVTDISRKETKGFGLPLLEAMACGCPVAASTVASLAEVCGNAAYYIDPYNVESIADGMNKVLTG